MNKKRLGLISFFVLLFSMNAFTQHISDLRLNEMLINNVDNYIDEYGRHVPWIEIFNSAYNNIDVAECYLTNDTTGLADGSGIKNWYRIPKGDPKTLLSQRSFVVFYMDNAPLYGTFHVNFDPCEEGSSNYVALISSNGRTLIDIFEFPEQLRTSTEHSYGYFDDGIKGVEDANGNTVSNKGFLDYFTPGSTNSVFMGLTKSEKVAQEDPYGLGLAFISMSVVFIALILIYLMLKLFARMNRGKAAKPAHGEVKTDAVVPKTKVIAEEFTGEELAAITMALHLHVSGQHDEESEVITIETPSAHYSPWSQKQLTFKQSPYKK
ncbi:MAG: OadG family protein [Bacteroidales bacterium]|jgi:Na+-transporting methylmalonyl-CoA/oxaloacetate decarboxylase gamma subunit|nr:OadG family protein [Bacteroidales bacterium]